MGKRSTFERRKNDLYITWDPRAVAALLPHLAPETRFVEPCAGDGTLANQLMAAGHQCEGCWDIDPQHPCVQRGDALGPIPRSAHAIYITNPPWTRDILHPLIARLSDEAPTWLLFDADWAHTKQATEFKPRLRNIVSVGRLKWIPGTKDDGKDNCAWYLFDRPSCLPTLFHGRS